MCGGRAGRTGAGALGFWPLHEKYSSMEHASCPSGTHRRPLPRPRPRRPGPGRGFNAPTCVSPTLRTLRREGGGASFSFYLFSCCVCSFSGFSFSPPPPFSLSFSLLLFVARWVRGMHAHPSGKRCRFPPLQRSAGSWCVKYIFLRGNGEGRAIRGIAQNSERDPLYCFRGARLTSINTFRISALRCAENKIKRKIK